MDEEKHLLSNWESKNIEVKSALEVLTKSVNDAVFNLRRILIGKKIDDLIKESISQNTNTVNLELIRSYTGLRMKLFDKLNRVV
jgi:DNA primase